MSWAGIPSVMQMTVAMPASTASNIASAAKRAGTKTMAVLAPVSRDRLLHRVEDGDPLDVLTALPRRHPGNDLRPVGLVPGRVEGAFAAR